MKPTIEALKKSTVLSIHYIVSEARAEEGERGAHPLGGLSLPCLFVPLVMLATFRSYYATVHAEARAGIIYRSGTLDDEGHIRLEDLQDTESMAAVRSMLLDGEALRLSGSLGSMVVTGAARGGNLRGGNLRCHQAGRRALVW